MGENHPRILNFHLGKMHFILKGDGDQVPLYPYQANTLKIVFFYGDDFKRQRISTFFNHFSSLLFNWFNFFILLSGILLCAIRRIGRLRSDGFISSFIDVLITFIGGGNLRINRHRLETWFFGSVFVASIFLNAIGLESSLFSSYIELDQRLETFDDLIQINPPFYISLTLKEHVDAINAMLRYVCYFIYE